MYDLVKTLTELPGPVGHEDAVQDWIAREWAGFAAEVRRTRVNNVLARVGGAGQRLLIMGHADEICLMVKSVDDDGFLRLWPFYGDQLGHVPRWFVAIQPARSRAGRFRPGRRVHRDRQRPRRRRSLQPEGPAGVERLLRRSRHRLPSRGRGARYSPRLPRDLESRNPPTRRRLHHRQGDGRPRGAGDRDRGRPAPGGSDRISPTRSGSPRRCRRRTG